MTSKDSSQGGEYCMALLAHRRGIAMNVSGQKGHDVRELSQAAKS